MKSVYTISRFSMLPLVFMLVVGNELSVLETPASGGLISFCRAPRSSLRLVAAFPLLITSSLSCLACPISTQPTSPRQIILLLVFDTFRMSTTA